MKATAAVRWMLTLQLVLLGAVGVALPAHAGLEIGDAAPDFQLMGSDGKVYSLRSLLAPERARDGVVLAWFPKAFTPG